MTNESFIYRVKTFWNWFCANEETLSSFVQNRELSPESGEQVIKLINEETSLLGENLHFNTGGNHEFTFAVSGNHPLFYLLPYVTVNLPEKFSNKWTFFPHMQGTGGQNHRLTAV